MRRKNNYALIFSVAGLIFLIQQLSYGQQVDFQYTIDDTTAIVNRPYYSQMIATATPDDESYSLDVALEGMTITPSGLIKWIPTDISKGGRVVVRATNSENETGTHEFYINVAEDVKMPSTAVAYWTLDEKLVELNDSVFKDYRGNHDARVTKTKPVDTIGVVGLAQDFSLVNNSEVIVPDNPVFNWASDQSFSIEFWFKMYPDDLNFNRVILGRNGGSNSPHWWIGLDNNDCITFTIRINETTFVELKSSHYFENFDWHHVVAVRDALAGKIWLYEDGNTDPLHQSTYTEFNVGDTDYGFITSAPFCIGWLKPGTGDGTDTYPYAGKLDEIIIHNEALSEDSILARYNNSKKGAGNYTPLFRTVPPTVVNEKSLYTYQYLASDMDNVLTTNSYDTVAGSRPSWLTWNKATRTFSGTPTNSDVGVNNVSIKVNDGHVDNFQNFQITVNNIDDPPILSNLETAALAYKEDDGAVTLTSAVTVSDVDDVNLDSARVWISANYKSSEDVLAFSNTANITGVWNATTGSLKLTGTTTIANYQAAIRSITYENTNTATPNTLTRTVSFTANDGEWNSTVVSKNIAVTAVNDCPVISGHAILSTPEDDTLLIKLSHLTFTDVDDAPGSFSVSVANGSNYSFSGNIVTPAQNFNGNLNVNVKLTDSKCIVDYVLPVAVTAVNDAPEFNFASLLKDAYEKQTYLSKLRATDPDAGDVISFSVIQKPDWLNVINDTILSGIPEFSDVGLDSITIRISDSHVNMDTSFVITVHTTNYKPRITSTPLTSINEDVPYIYNIVVADTNSGDHITLTAPGLPDWLTLNSDQQTLTGTPTNALVGYLATADYPVQLIASDGKQDSVQSFIITVHNVNDAPVIKGQADTLIGYPDSSLVIKINDLVVEDVDNPLSELTLIILPGANYSLTENTITIKTSVLGLIKVNVRVEDPGKLKDQDTIYVRVAHPTAIENVSLNDNSMVRVYPIPAQDLINFEILESGNYFLELMDITGKKIYEEYLGNGERVATINTTVYPKGIYLYKIYNNNSVLTGVFAIR